MPLPIPSKTLLESLPTPSTVEESDPERKAKRETDKTQFLQPNTPLLPSERPIFGVYLGFLAV